MQKKLQQIMLFLLVYFTQPLLNCAAAEADPPRLPRLIPQRVFHDLPAIEVVDGEEHFSKVFQRDCVENLARNFLCLAFLYPNGEIRPGVQEKILDKSSILNSYFTGHSVTERLSDTQELGREWLDKTIGFEELGVKYLQGNREVSTGIDTILALMEALMPELKLREEADISSKLRKLCKYLSSETLTITPPTECSNLTYADIKLKFKPLGSKKPHTVTLYIGVGHVSIRQGSDYVS